MLKGTDPRARDLLADVLLGRAIFAEDTRRTEQRDEILARLAVYDRDGSRMSHLRAPGRVRLSTPGVVATVQTQRIVGGKPIRSLQTVGPTKETPVELELANGCYVLTVSAPGRSTVTYPLCLGRDESLPVALSLPQQKDIPAGFSFVPAGRFLYGDTNEEERKGFLDTVPLHVVSTGAFLIAKNETTMGDWIAYLEALPSAESIRRQPHGGVGVAGNAISLTPLGSGRWQFKIQPKVQLYTAKSGEPLIFSERREHREQNWLRLPVVGVDADDATAYVSWLDKSRRVPHARLCTEQEWERAARGADDRIYPHGDDLAPEDANFDETYGRRPWEMGPDEVGSHPKSRSVFGLDDMAGNVLEWTRSMVPGQYAVRGGSYYYSRRASRSTNREVVEPGARNSNVGLRVCADTIAAEGSPSSD
jgi:formylglycine-generating enzyme required for sulfatase activity